MNKDLGHDLAAAETLQEYLVAALADGLRVRVSRDDFTAEVREFVAGQVGWLVIGGEEDTHFVVCPPREPMAPPTAAEVARWALIRPPQQRTQQMDPRGFWDILRGLTRR